jgi:hypothetical protein
MWHNRAIGCRHANESIVGRSCEKIYRGDRGA